MCGPAVPVGRCCCCPGLKLKRISQLLPFQTVAVINRLGLTLLRAEINVPRTRHKVTLKIRKNRS